MANKSYLSNYLKIYFWQGTAFVMRFLSLFIVTPFLTKDPTIYGIYAVCVSITIFLIYADLGFLRAVQKYAAECYAKSDRDEEMRYIGFGGFVLLIFTGIITLLFYFLSIYPEFLIKGLYITEKIKIASKLLLILAFFTPLTIFQRMSSMIFDIRLDGYINQRLSLFSSLIVILSALYFFRKGYYDIIGYFLFSQILNLVVVVISFIIIVKNYNYSLISFFKNIKFKKKLYDKTKRLAYSGLYIIVMWILFYELDQIVISKFLGASKVAIFAIAFSFSSLFRSIFGILFAPFTIRSNHFVGNDNNEQFNRFCLQVVSLCAPIVLLPTLALVLVAKPIVLTWVGESYIESIALARFFPLSFSLSFISYTLTIILVAKEKTKEMYIMSTLQPIIYWAGIAMTFSICGLLSFGIFKLFATLITEIYSFHLLVKFLKISIKEFLKILYPVIFPVIFLAISLSISNIYLPVVKSKSNLFIVLFTTGVCICLSFIIQYATSSYIRNNVKSIFYTLKSSD